MLAAASAAGMSLSACSKGKKPAAEASTQIHQMYELPPFGNVSLFHITDVHAQLLPTWFREPNINIGLGSMMGNPPHLVGNNLLKYFNISPNSPEAHALTHINFVEAAKQYGKVGGFSHLATLIKSLRQQRKASLLLDGGDNWQGSATSYWTKGQDMVDASKLLGVDIMTGHWEFTYGAERVKQIVDNDFKDQVDFLAQNVFDKDWGDQIFKPYVIKQLNGINVAIIGQAFPYTPIANPLYLVPTWSFGIREEELQNNVKKARKEGAAIVVLLSHNGMDVDLKLASIVSGIDIILGGHTHDAIPAPVTIKNSSGRTLVFNSGCNGKFLSVLDLDVQNGKLKDFRYKLLPVFSNFLPADPQMEQLIAKIRKPFESQLNQPLAVTEDLLFRRGNFNGTFDQLILDAMLEVQGAEIAFSPGFRWGVSVMPGEIITYEQVLSQTAITYPTATLNNLTGERIKEILEDVADNLFNVDPYKQQGGDMVRVGGLKFSIDPNETIGKRIADMELNGKPLQASKEYLVAGWASVQDIPVAKPIWDVVAEYLKSVKTVKAKELNLPKIRNMPNNPGIAS